MRKKFGRRWIAAISVLSLLAPWSVTAQTELYAAQPVEKEPVSEAAQAFDQIQELPKNIQALLSDVASAKDDVVVPSDDPYELTVQHADGSYTTEVYATPVKYTDDNGETQYIDTAMKDRSVWDVVTFNQTRRNQNGYVDLAYAARVTDGVEVDNAFSLSVPAQKGQKKAVSTETDEGDGKIVYPQAFGENTYVEYINTYSGFKENIVLEKNIGKNTFDFVWESDEYMPVLTDDDKAICVVPKNDPTQSEYTISPLYVYDSFDPTTAEKPSTHKHWTDDCRYDILEQDDGSYIVRAIVSEEYLNHPETVYPVTIDPSVNAGSASSNVDDSFVKESAKTTNYGTYNYLQFGYASGKMYSFVQFNKMPALAAGAHYTNATFKVTFRTGQDTPAKMKATARWCDSSFAEKKLTWNNRPYGKVAQSSVLPKITNGYLDYYNFTVTDAVQRHYKDGVDVALVFTYQNETYADYNSVVSSEGDAARNPKLTINYTKSTGETAGITNNACYYIRNKATNKYLGLREGGFISVEQQARTGKANQLWKLQYNGKDAYRLASQSLANSYMYAAVDMDGGSVYAVSPQSDDIAGGYEFMIEPVTTGYYRVSSKAVSTLYALTGGRYDSEDASVYPYTGANDQQWAFEKYTLSLSAAKNWVAAGSTLTLKPSSTVLGIAWSSSNNAVATVKGGIVTGVKPGTATITASAGGATAKYTVKVTRKYIERTQSLLVGMSADGYAVDSKGNSTCSYEPRVSLQCANGFWRGIGSNLTDRTLQFYHYNNGDIHSQVYATKRDFLSKSDNNIPHDNIDNVDLMLFVGHGTSSDGMHFSQGSNGYQHSAAPSNHSVAELNFRLSEAKFGYGSARTKWVAAYTCNFLTHDLDELKLMMQGSNVVLGYCSTAYLIDKQMELFGSNLDDGEAVIDAWFDSSSAHSQYSPIDSTMAAVYVEDARQDTIYKYLGDTQDYSKEKICELTHMALRAS